MATENKTSEYDAEQNMAIAILNALNNANQPDGGNSADTSGDTAALIEMLQGNAPQGMDFSAFQPLMAAMGDTSFTRENAIADSKGFINQIFRDYEKSSLPSIYKNARATGIYNAFSTYRRRIFYNQTIKIIHSSIKYCWKSSWLRSSNQYHAILQEK